MCPVQTVTHVSGRSQLLTDNSDARKLYARSGVSAAATGKRERLQAVSRGEVRTLAEASGA
jgi:hypothetical protein